MISKMCLGLLNHYIKWFLQSDLGLSEELQLLFFAGGNPIDGILFLKTKLVLNFLIVHCTLM
jgi:hypothetical protein